MSKVRIISRLLPKDSTRRKGYVIPSWITIHETSLGTEKTPSDCNYERYHDLLLSKDGSTIGYHFLVEANYKKSTRIYQFLETFIATDHTGNLMGNRLSIGIERLVNVDTDFERAIDAQAQLTASLMDKYCITIDHVVPHKFWSGKECPNRLLDGQYGGWEGFIQKVEKYYNSRDFVEIKK